MTDITPKYMSSAPRQGSAVVPMYSAVTPGRPPQESPPAPITAVEMTYKVVKKLLAELPPAEQAECLRRLSKDIFESVTT